MSLLAVCQWLQNTSLSTGVRESTWGFPILGALHVLGIAWFGGVFLFSDLRPEFAAPLRRWRRLGVSALLLTGVLLFLVEPLKCYHSLSFQLKLALLITIALNAVLLRGKLAAGISWFLWAAVIFAARGIAFF